MTVTKDLPDPSARMTFEGGPLDGLVLDWTHGPNFPIEIALRFSEINAEDGVNREIVYHAAHCYQDGDILPDDMPARETQEYWLKSSTSEKGRDVQTAWNETEPADDDERQ